MCRVLYRGNYPNINEWDSTKPKTYTQLCEEHIARYNPQEAEWLRKAQDNAFGYCMRCSFKRQLICKLFADPYCAGGECLWVK